ncbi:LysR family transcriptional regulator [Cupriavidus lacunae]|uniref:LysR family transcriptional regulator n=1 Tax=Cupriavidus lacunae TaxID=2666307 RepID=A0A370NK72_9BURK|nr:LysR family transcriptional regulator [Cupriavidus lacunae]RDK05990.1 LysR family transcriptional regulator [Cupriavidus lacunae]
MLIDDLHAFVSVARTRSFSAAAIRLRVAQSSLSKRVSRLEQHFGTALFLRHGRGVSLTAAGTVLLANAEGLLREVERIEADVRGINAEPEGLVRIAMPPATGPVLAPMVLERCVVEYPKIVPQIREGTSDAIHQWLSSGEVDVAMMYNPELGPAMEVQPLVTEPLFLIMPGTPRARALTRAEFPEACAVEDLARLPLILPRSPHSIRVLVDRLCAGHNVHPNVVFESDSIRSTKGIVERGLGCTIFSRSFLVQELSTGRLAAVPFKSALAAWQLCLVMPRRDQVSMAIRAVRRVILEQATRLYQERFWQDARFHIAADEPSSAQSSSRD